MTLGRRHFLRGLGTFVGLPAFESLLAPHRSEAADDGSRPVATTVNGAPLRTAFLYIPNGVNIPKWAPKGYGHGYQLSETLQPIAEHRMDFQILSGLGQRNTTAGDDGGGNHARAMATFLTGVRPHKTAGADIHLGTSIDQVMARAVGDQTRFGSLELTCDATRKAGACDSGYSCIYRYNMSWRNATTPVTPESNPKLVFERLFGAGNRAERSRTYQQRMNENRSVLDFVLEEANHLHRRLGRNDQAKLDEYLTSVRDIEYRLQRLEQFGPPPAPPDGTLIPGGVPADFEGHIRLMMDLIVLAFQTDTTRVAAFCLAHDESARTFPSLGITEGHHGLSHHGKDVEKLVKLAQIDLFYSRQLAYFLDRMKAAQDFDGHSLLYNSMCVWASGLSDGDHHSPWNLPVILAGRGGGRLGPGSHELLAAETPMTNLYRGLLEHFGAPQDRFGDSTGVVTQI